MANEAKIILSSGLLREGETIELVVDYQGDALSFSHPMKKWRVFAEKDIKHDIYSNDFYYEEGDGEVFDAVDSDNIIVRRLIPGRLFAIFEYETFGGEYKRIVETFKILPKLTISISDDIIQGKDAIFSTSTTFLNTVTTWSFTDGTADISGGTINKITNNDGYYNVNANINYTNAKYSNGENVIWQSIPENLIPHLTTSFLAGASATAETIEENISGTYLSKFDLDTVLDLDIKLSKSVDNDTVAPLSIFVSDLSTYSIGVSGDNKIEYTYIDYGDGNAKKGLEPGFTTTKVYKRSGSYFGTFSVYTVHSTDNGPDYRQTKTIDISVEVTPFFAKWLKDHLSSELFSSKGFDDLATAWGVQMDRLYNEAQILIDSIDVEQIDEKFIRSFAATYGDFVDIYEKIGFKAFVKDKDKRYDYLDSYNFFDRLESGNMTKAEKKEFLNYIQSSRKRLQLKGTPVSMETAIAQFGLISIVKELWTDSFKIKANIPLTDEIFSKDEIINNTGISYRTISTPSSDNINSPIINSSKNSHIEINTINKSESQFFTSTSMIKVINGEEYVVFQKNQ